VTGSRDAQTRTIQEWAAAWSAHDVDRLLRLFTDDIVYEDVPMGVTRRGTRDVRAFVEEVLSRFPDIQFELRSSVSDGASGAAEWMLRGTRDPTGTSGEGRHVGVRGASIFEFVGDRVRRCSDYWDMATYLRQLGLTLPDSDA
jgi:steroid delta-isomerase-like uncharacterized protein